MKKKNIFKVVFTIWAMSVPLLCSLNACADNWNHNQNQSHSQNHSQNQNGNHDYHHHDNSYVDLNFGVSPDPYYYDPAPMYYPPPEEIDVPQAPVYQPMVVNGTTYYVNNGIYYIYTGLGYQVVQPPVTTVVQAPAPTPTPIIEQPEVTSSTVSDDTFTVNVPNTKGSYTAVTLKKSGTGYIGPQGEYYADFPKIAQLEAMYGK